MASFSITDSKNLCPVALSFFMRVCVALQRTHTAVSVPSFVQVALSSYAYVANSCPRISPSATRQTEHLLGEVHVAACQLCPCAAICTSLKLIALLPFSSAKQVSQPAQYQYWALPASVQVASFAANAVIVCLCVSPMHKNTAIATVKAAITTAITITATVLRRVPPEVFSGTKLFIFCLLLIL